MRTTHSLVEVTLALLEDLDGRHWGYDLAQKSGVRSGVLYPILGRMLDDGWLEDGWEDPSEISEKRPPRRYYTITERGARELGAVASLAKSDARFARLQGRFA